MTLNLPPALLEDWMRDYYFSTEIDIGSSGVQDLSMPELRRLVGLDLAELDEIVFHDSQTLGGADLRRALAERFSQGRSDRTMATHGSTEANFLVMNSLLEAGDEVLVLDPIYPQLSQIAEGLGCRLVRWPLRFEEGFRPDLGEARSLLNPRTKMVVVNFPHNPTGASLSVEEQAELLELCAGHGAYLVWDNAFGDITYDEPPLPDPHVRYDRCISMGTMSKSYGLPGLRLGWCLAEPEVLQRFVLLRDYMTLHLSPLVERVATRVIDRADDVLALARQRSARNLDLLESWVAEHEGLVEWQRPRGGVCSFPRLPGVRDVEAFCETLGRKLRVLLVPGSCFGQPQHVRLGFGGEPGRLQEGLERFSKLLHVVD